eukprot:6205106-Pleurochrysis_carterae.AAC.2
MYFGLTSDVNDIHRSAHRSSTVFQLWRITASSAGWISVCRCSMRLVDCDRARWFDKRPLCSCHTQHCIRTIKRHQTSNKAYLKLSKPVVLAICRPYERKSVMTAEAAPSNIGAPASGVVNSLCDSSIQVSSISHSETSQQPCDTNDRYWRRGPACNCVAQPERAHGHLAAPMLCPRARLRLRAFI